MGKKVLSPITKRLVDIGEPEEMEEDRRKRLEVMFSPERLKRIMSKELRRYKDAQERRWRRWMDSMSK